MINETFIRRRKFLQRIFLVTAVTVPRVGSGFSLGPSVEQIADQTTSILRYPDLARELGQRFLEQHPQIAALNLEQLVVGIFKGTAVDPKHATYFSFFDLDDEIIAKVRLDFVQENISTVDGWVLAETEVYLCALLATIEKA